MKYPKTEQYDKSLLSELIMGPNPLKLLEELMLGHEIPAGGEVLDLGCGKGLTSAFLAKEYHFRVTALDLWIDAAENQRLFKRLGLSPEQIRPIQGDATALPFPQNYFDAVVSVDSYNYFGRDAAYLDAHLLPHLKPQGLFYAVIPGMKRDCHDHIPPELLLSWTPEQLEYMHDIPWWEAILKQAKGAELLSIRETEGNEECWADWLACENEYARGDRKAMEAGAGKYLNFIAFVMRKK